MERIVARKLVQDLERRNVLPLNQGGYRAGKNHLGKRSHIRIRCLRRIPEEGTNSGRGGRSGRCVQQSAILTELLVQYVVSLTLTRWLGAALQERKVAMRLGNWISTPKQLTMGLPQCSPCPQSSTMSTQRDWQI